MRFVGDMEKTAVTQTPAIDVFDEGRQELVQKQSITATGCVVLPAEDLALPTIDPGDDLRAVYSPPLGEQVGHLEEPHTGSIGDPHPAIKPRKVEIVSILS